MSLTDDAHPPVILDRKDFPALLDSLANLGYRIIGPTIRDNAIIYDDITGVDDLPLGWIDRQKKGKYRLARHKKKMLFAYVVGPHSWKRFVYPVQKTILQASRSGKKTEIIVKQPEVPKQAFIGVRSCELHALGILDTVFTKGPYPDAVYAECRKQSFIVAVNCVRAGGTCFCVSMNTGPKASSGFDIALTEVVDGERHYFVMETGSEKGAAVIDILPHRDAGAEEIENAEKAIRYAASRMGRELDTEGLPELLVRNFEHAHWDDIASRCLTCGNCTQVCPTCFCSTIVDFTDLTGTTMERSRQWDTCFSLEFSYIHGGSIRNSPMSRYRQWMMHKLAYWPEQFGTFGCTGCGRCITWCPVGIDITEEARIIRKSE